MEKAKKSPENSQYIRVAHIVHNYLLKYCKIDLKVFKTVYEANCFPSIVYSVKEVNKFLLNTLHEVFLQLILCNSELRLLIHVLPNVLPELAQLPLSSCYLCYMQQQLERNIFYQKDFVLRVEQWNYLINTLDQVNYYVCHPIVSPFFNKTENVYECNG